MTVHSLFSLRHTPAPAAVPETGGQRNSSVYEVQSSRVEGTLTLTVHGTNSVSVFEQSMVPVLQCVLIVAGHGTNNVSEFEQCMVPVLHSALTVAGHGTNHVSEF